MNIYQENLVALIVENIRCSHLSQILDNLNYMLSTNIKNVPKFIRILLSNMKKSYLKNTHELLSIKSCDNHPRFSVLCISL